MKRIFNGTAEEFKLSKSIINDIWDSQFKFVTKIMRENYCNEAAPSIKLVGLGTFKCNPFRIRKFKENYDKKYRSEEPSSGITKINN